MPNINDFLSKTEQLLNSYEEDLSLWSKKRVELANQIAAFSFLYKIPILNTILYGKKEIATYNNLVKQMIELEEDCRYIERRKKEAIKLRERTIKVTRELEDIKKTREAR